METKMLTSTRFRSSVTGLAPLYMKCNWTLIIIINQRLVLFISSSTSANKNPCRLFGTLYCVHVIL